MIASEGASPIPGSRAAASADRLALFDMSERTKLRFAGPQALWFLDQLVTNKVDELSPGAGTEALLLTPKGRITSHLRIVHRPDSAGSQEVLVDAPPGHAGQLLDFFGMRVFATKVSISDISDELGILRVMGAGAPDVLGKVFGIEAPQALEHGSANFSGDGIEGLAVRLMMPAPGLDLWVSAGSCAQAIERLTAAGAQPLSQAAYDSFRITAGLAQFGVDFDESYLPQEAALERAVHFSKGCYLGQEAVAMAQRGRTKRRLRHLEFRGAGARGKVLHGDIDAGRVTSAAEADGRWFGIGAVRTDVAVNETVHVLPEVAEGVGSEESSFAAAVKELPGTTYGPTTPSARELREKLQGG